MATMDAAREAPRIPPRLFFFLRFLVVALSVLGAVHFYFWLRLVHDTALPEPWWAAATALLVVLGASIPLAFATRGRKSVVSLAAYVWMGALGLLFLSLLGVDVIRIALSAAGHAPAPRLAEGGAALVVATMVGAGLVNARRLEVVPIEIALAKLPRSLDGFVIAQISDLHIGSTIGREMVQEVVDRTNALAADLIVITGDVADGDPRALAGAAAPLAELKAKHGVFFVTGNHEYFGDVEGWLSLLTSLGIRILRNERLAIGEGESSFELAGIDDHVGRMQPGHGPDLPRALNGRDPAKPLVLLAHRPHALREASPHGVDLVLSGHTHAGQIWPFNYLVKLDQPYVAGHYRHGDSQLYVSQGTGWWGPPMRLGTTREITKITLRALVS